MKRNLLRLTYAVIIVGLAVCCVAAVRPDLFGIAGMDKTVMSSDEATSVDALAVFVLEREQLRSMQISQLDEIINAPASQQTLIDAAQEEKLEIVRRMEIEQTIAGILKLRGYEDAAVAASGTSVNVMIRNNEMTDADTAIVLELVLAQTSVEAADVRIIPIN